VQRGLIQKRKLYNSKPDGYNGFAINTRRKPIDDIRVRKALTLLFNRALIIEKIYLNEYLPMNSYYSGTVYENPNNPKNLYNPDEALRLLAEAGWKGRDSQGRLTKDGRPLELELLYPDKGSEIYLTVYQEDLRKVGITLNLRLVTFETQFKLMNQRQFDLALVAWGVGPFPDPEIEFHSRLADVNNSGNITGFKLKRIDEICDLYARTFDQSERVALMKELDGILTNEYHYILRIHAPAERIAYWNRYGAPAGHVTRMGDYYSSWSLGPGPDQLWWVDPQKARKLEEAMRDSSLKLEVGATEDRYWLNREGK
jgi:microcin C transport system substrate-binding protein